MGFESRKQTSRAGNLRLLAGCAAQWFKGGGGGGFRVALTGRCMSGRSHQGRGFGSARALPGAHRRRWPPHAPCGRDCAIMRRLIGSFHRNKTNFSGGGGPSPRKLVLVRDWKDTLTTVKSLRRLRGGAKTGKMPAEIAVLSTIVKSMKWALDISWCGVFDFSRAVT